VEPAPVNDAEASWVSQVWVREVAQLVDDPVALDEDFELAEALAAGAVVVGGTAEPGADVGVGAAVEVVVGAVVVVEREAFLAAGELDPQAAARRVTASKAKAACEARGRR
jgi:hypothetical protein